MIIKEDLLLSNYSWFVKERSKIDPSQEIVVEERMRCPYCGKTQKAPHHGETIVCKCGLRMIVHGNSLTCELEK